MTAPTQPDFSSFASAQLLVWAERHFQVKKFGQQDHADEKWIAILAEEVGEAAKDVLEGNGDGLRRELVQTAAVCLAWLECLDRRIPDAQPVDSRYGDAHN